MPGAIPLDELRRSQTACLFQGDEHGDGIPVSMFVTAHPPGGGPGLHVHPYAEMFLVQAGTATFTRGEDELTVTAGHVVVVPPETPHRFENTGEDTLRIVSVHPAGTIQQTWL